jgi:hypothetical protein
MDWANLKMNRNEEICSDHVGAVILRWQMCKNMADSEKKGPWTKGLFARPIVGEHACGEKVKGDKGTINLLPSSPTYERKGARFRKSVNGQGPATTWKNYGDDIKKNGEDMMKKKATGQPAPPLKRAGSISGVEPKTFGIC